MAKDSETDLSEEIIESTQQLLAAISGGDWATYERLCDPSLTAFEPEALGHLVTGLDFHRYYFQLERSGFPVQNSIVSPHVRVIGDVAVIAYVRITQSIGPNGKPISSAMEETRIWHRNEQGQWVHVHFHRSKRAAD